jgi:hypothetical protein
MDRNTQTPPPDTRKDATEGRADDEPPPDPRRDDADAPTDHRFRDWALI